MEPSRKWHVFEWSLFLWPSVRWRLWKLQAAAINHLHDPVKNFTFCCSGTQIYGSEIRNEGSGQSWDNDRA